jgi:acylphosphatase
VICKKCLVGGRVQGVFYRATVAHRARELGITGYAKNLPDGRVEVLALGDASSVEEFIVSLWKGSTASKVTSVEATDVTLPADQRPPDFTTG